MTWTTTPPSKPGLYWILFDGSSDLPIGGSVGKLTKDGDWRIIGFSQSMTAEKIVAMGGWFGSRIEPPRDDDEELATVEWFWFYAESSGMNPRRHDDEDGVAVTIDASCGTIWLTNLKIVGVCLSVCDGVEGDDEANVCPVATNPTRRKVRQIVEALR